MADKSTQNQNLAQKKAKSSSAEKENVDPLTKKESGSTNKSTKATKSAIKRSAATESDKKTDSSTSSSEASFEQVKCAAAKEVERIMGLFPSSAGLPKIPKLTPAAASGTPGQAPQDPRRQYVPGSYTLHSTPKPSNVNSRMNSGYNQAHYYQEEEEILPVYDPSMYQPPMFYSPPPPMPMWDPSFYYHPDFEDYEEEPQAPVPFQYPDQQEQDFQGQNAAPVHQNVPVQQANQNPVNAAADQNANQGNQQQQQIVLPEDMDEEAILNLGAAPQPGPGQVLQGHMVQGPPNNPNPPAHHAAPGNAMDFLEDELEEPEEEVGPAMANPRFPTIFDAVWNQPIKNPSKNRMKKIYAAQSRPNDVNNIVKTQVNTLIKNALSKEAFRKDAHPKSIQTAVIKGALGIVQVMDKLFPVENFEAKRDIEIQLLRSLRCLAYASAKTNELRRKNLKPHLDKKFHSACDNPKTPSHLWLFGEDVVEELKEAEQVAKIERSLASQRRPRRARNYNSFWYNPAYAYNYWSRGFVPRGRRFFGRGKSGYYYFQEPITRLDQRPPLLNSDIQSTKHLRNCVLDLAVDSSLQHTNFEAIRHEVQKVCAQNNHVDQGFSGDDFLVSHRGQPMEKQQRRQDQPTWTWQQSSQPQQPELDWLFHESDTPDSQVREQYIRDLNIHFPPFRAGGVSKCLPEWRKLTSDPEILNLVQGVHLDFTETPTQNKIPHELKFSKEETPLVIAELEKFLLLGIIKKSSIQPGDFVSNLFTRPKKEAGRIRLIANLKSLNEWIGFVHFKMDGIEDVINLMKPGMYMVSIDFTSSFYSINVDPQYRRYLKVICLGQIYEYQALPMGCSRSPLIFCKLLKVPLAYLREAYGYTNSAFVDDVWMGEDTIPEIEQNAKDSLVLFQDLGYTANIPKSDLGPGQIKPHLGLIFNTLAMTVSLTEEKIRKFIDHAKKILKSETQVIRTVASLIGQMNAARYAVRYGPLHTKSL